jgi:2-polyprenyl-3-methyl-5-hydroxy-6-metoxy-1,4-benzoquinol methylase
VQPDYAAHEQVYQALRRQPDRAGWDEAAALARDVALLDAVLAWPEFPAPGRLLELGCGAGNIALHLARRGWDVQGVDIAPTAIAWAREHAARDGLAARFDVDDVLTLAGQADAQCDVVLDGHCLHCIIGADRPRVLAAVQRVLRPGGALLVRTMCDQVPASVAAQFDAASRCVVRGGVPNRYIGRAGDLLQELAAAGYRVARWQVEPPLGADDAGELFALAIAPGPKGGDSAS